MKQYTYMVHTYILRCCAMGLLFRAFPGTQLQDVGMRVARRADDVYMMRWRTAHVYCVAQAEHRRHAVASTRSLTATYPIQKQACFQPSQSPALFAVSYNYLKLTFCVSLEPIRHRLGVNALCACNCIQAPHCVETHTTCSCCVESSFLSVHIIFLR